jgi:hypothetical protein
LYSLFSSIAAICAIAFANYVAINLRVGVIEDKINETTIENDYVARYVDWSITTPLLVLTILLRSKISNPSIMLFALCGSTQPGLCIFLFFAWLVYPFLWILHRIPVTKPYLNNLHDRCVLQGRIWTPPASLNHPLCAFQTIPGIARKRQRPLRIPLDVNVHGTLLDRLKRIGRCHARTPDFNDTVSHKQIMASGILGDGLEMDAILANQKTCWEPFRHCKSEHVDTGLKEGWRVNTSKWRPTQLCPDLIVCSKRVMPCVSRMNRLNFGNRQRHDLHDGLLKKKNKKLEKLFHQFLISNSITQFPMKNPQEASVFFFYKI